MNENVMKILSDKPIIIPRVLLNNYVKLNITEEELLIIMVIISLSDKMEYNPDIFVRELSMDRHRVMRLISSLIGKNILSLEVVRNGRKTEEYISVTLLYEKLFNIIIDKKDDIAKNDDSIFNVFENELGRLLSPMEIETIKEWVNTYKNNELIIEALKEAVLNGVSNLRYIDAILNDWNKKGYRNKDDVLKDKSNYKKKKNTTQVFDTDWLNNE